MLRMPAMCGHSCLLSRFPTTARVDKICPPFLFGRGIERIADAQHPHKLMANSTLAAAKAAKNDEFYTQLVDIERELVHYKEHFRGKTVLCNCDDPRVSNFFKYFTLNFEYLGLKRVIATCYKSQDVDLFSTNTCEHAVYQIYDGDKDGNSMPDANEIEVRPLKGDGDFRSPECVELLRQADIVVTNPPFSLFREYISQLVAHHKCFLVIGNMNAISYQEIFPLICDNIIWLGCTSGKMTFGVPDDYESKTVKTDNGNKFQSMGNTCWYTNLDHHKRHEELVLYKKYSPEEYPRYDNYDAINVDKVTDIPCDYEGVMGIPITFLDKYNPEQFELIGLMASTGIDDYNKGYPYIKGVKKYARVLAKLKK